MEFTKFPWVNFGLATASCGLPLDLSSGPPLAPSGRGARATATGAGSKRAFESGPVVKMKVFSVDK